MIVQGFLSGFITLGRSKKPIAWTGMGAQHIAENYITENGSHPILHVSIQQMAAKIRNWKKTSYNSVKTYRAQGIHDGINFAIFIVIHSKFAQIKTCYKLGDSMKAKTKKISGTEYEEINWYEPGIEAMVRDGYYPSVEEAKKDMIMLMIGEAKAQKKLKKKGE